MRGRSWRFLVVLGGHGQHENEVISYVPQEIRPYVFRVGKVVLAMCTKDRANYVYTLICTNTCTFCVFFQELYKYYILHDILVFFLQTRGSRGFSVTSISAVTGSFGKVLRPLRMRPSIVLWKPTGKRRVDGWELDENSRRSAADEDWDLVLTSVTCSANPVTKMSWGVEAHSGATDQWGSRSQLHNAASTLVPSDMAKDLPENVEQDQDCELSGEQGQEVESEEELQWFNLNGSTVQDRQCGEVANEKDWPIDKAPGSSCNWVADDKEHYIKFPAPDKPSPRGRATSAESECSGRLSKFPMLCRKGFTRLKESSRMALPDGSFRGLHQRDAWSVSSVAGAFGHAWPQWHVHHGAIAHDSFWCRSAQKNTKDDVICAAICAARASRISGATSRRNTCDHRRGVAWARWLQEQAKIRILKEKWPGAFRPKPQRQKIRCSGWPEAMRSFANAKPWVAEAWWKKGAGVVEVVEMVPCYVNLWVRQMVFLRLVPSSMSLLGLALSFCAERRVQVCPTKGRDGRGSCADSLRHSSWTMRRLPGGHHTGWWEFLSGHVAFCCKSRRRCQGD